MSCPACNKPMNGRILVCETCWFKVPPKDRHTFRAQYVRSPKNPDAWSAIAAKIIRNLK